MTTKLSGKTILVTGASSGIGLATVQGLLDRGAKVLGVTRKASKLPGEVTAIEADLTKRSEVEGIFKNLGVIDALVNSAGVAYLARITDGDPDEWDEMWKLNVRALTLCCQLALSHFPEDGGRIINVSSMSGHRVPPTGGFYSPTKYAVKGVTEALRLELRAAGSPVQVGLISPGFVDTPLLNTYFKGREDALKQTKESNTMLRPEDVALCIIETLEKPAYVDISDIIIRS